MDFSANKQFPPYQVEVCRVEPFGFSPKVHVAACYISSNNEYLFLHRAKGTSQEYTWGIPAGKREGGESAQKAVMREVHEETGIQLKGAQLQDIGALYVRYPHLDFTFHMFKYVCTDRPEVCLSSEHQDYRWATVDEALHLPLISGGKETLEHFLALAH